MIRILKDIEIEVITHFDEMADHCESVDMKFLKEEVLFADIVERRESDTDLMIEGAMVYCLDNDCFEVIPD